MTTAGERFASGIAAKDSAALYEVIAQDVDFQALTPGRHWEARTAREVVTDIIFGRWFDSGDDIREMRWMRAGRVGDREHVSYRMLVRRAGADYLVEQQAYYNDEAGRITWMRILCSGYQPVPVESLARRP